MAPTSVRIGQVILLEASLSFRGLGLAPGDPAWGIMVAGARESLTRAWWIALFPGLVITVVMAFNFFGDWLRDYLDPGCAGPAGAKPVPDFPQGRRESSPQHRFVNTALHSSGSRRNCSDLRGSAGVWPP